VPIIQPSAPAHEAAPPRPCTKRETSSITTLSANAKPMLETTSRVRPMSTVGLTPRRAASQPPGSAPTKVPAGYAAARMPAAVFDRPYSSLSSGRIGVIAA
jgi:hypothetical protein